MGILTTTAIVAIVAIISAFVFVVTDFNKSDSSGSISIDTEYGRIIIEDGKRDGEKVRYYRQSGSYSSATYLEDSKKYDLVFDYLKKYDRIFDFTNVSNVAMIGGAAYQYPKYFISHYPDKTMDVIEIDPASTKIAREYFYLNDLIDDYDLDNNGRLGLYNEDGRMFFADTDKKYDAILNDAFSGEVPVGTLATVEAAQIIKERLNSDGVYFSNVLGAVDGDLGRFLRSEVKTLKEVFNHVYVVPVYDNIKKDRYINWMVIATDNGKYIPEDAVEVSLTNKDLVLTDNYNPVDDLTSTHYHDD